MIAESVSTGDFFNLLINSTGILLIVFDFDRFQSEDLTAQRRSFKCFRRLDDGNGHVPEATSFINLSTNIWVVAISFLTLMTAITAIIVYIIKSKVFS